MKSIRYSLYFVVLGMLLSQCSQKNVFSETKSIQNEEWSKENLIEFSFEIADTLALYDVVLKVTNTDDYPLANLYMFSNIILPNNTYYRDTIEFILSNIKGEWTGNGWFSYTNTFLFQQGVKFPHKGKYDFVFEQAMRCRNENCSLQGIKSIAIEVNKR